MSLRARPGIIFWALGYPRPDRVAFDIAGRGDEVSMIERTRIKPALPKTSSPVFSKVDCESVFPIRLRHNFGQTIRSLGNRDHMGVIRHQAITPKDGSRLISVFLEKPKIINSVLIAKKDLLAPVSALDDMMGDPRDDDACDAGHFSVSNASQTNKKKPDFPPTLDMTLQRGSDSQ